MRQENHQQLDLTEEKEITGYHWLLFGICFLANVFGGTVSTLMSVYLPVAANDLLGKTNVDLNFVSAYVNSVFIFGWAIGGIAWGFLSDRFGRSQAMIISIGAFGVFTILTGFTNSWLLVMMCRFFSGFGVGGILVITPTLLSEVWPLKTRSIFLGILSIGFPVGIFSSGLIDLFVSNWHQAFMIGVVPLTLSILCIFLVSESKEWQLTKEVNVNIRTKPSAFNLTYRQDLTVATLTFGAMLIGLWAIFSWLPSWVQNLLQEGDGQRERGIAMMFLGAGGLLGGFFSGWLSNAIGHRKAMMLCFGICFIMSFLLFKLNTTFSILIYIEIALLAIFFGASQGVLSGYIPELFPPSIRATATGLSFNIGRFVTASVVFFVGALVVTLGGYGNAIFIFSLVFLVGLVATYYSREPQIKK